VCRHRNPLSPPHRKLDPDRARDREAIAVPASMRPSRSIGQPIAT
jgi:hypothetical protein